MSGRRRSRFDVTEVVLVASLAMVAGVVGGRAWIGSSDQRDALVGRYGAVQWSQFDEELIVRDFFQDRRGGVFVDVGAADARRHSNTYLLESQLDWSGIAIDALPEHADSYKRYRPRTRFFSFFVSDRSDATATLFVDAGNQNLSSVSKDFMRERGRDDIAAREVPTVTLTHLLDRERVDRIDFLSMDIELAEPKALTGFEIGRFRPALVCIESHPQVRQWLMDYFSRAGYVLQTKYMYVDRNNFWFAPISTSPTDPPTP